jgi:hypothetical protein
MAIGKKNQNNSGKAFSVKLKLKDGVKFLDCAEFEIQEKQGDQYVTLKGDALKALVGTDGPIHDISGDLISIDTRTGKFEGKPILNVTLGLRDPEKNEIYFTSFVANSAFGRGLANSILNLQDFTNVQIGLYSQKNKETNKVYPAVALRQGTKEATVKWKYDPKTDENVKAETFKGRGGKTESDYTKVDEFLFSKIKEMSETVKSNRPKSTAPEKTAAPEQVDDSGPQGGDQDVPF